MINVYEQIDRNKRVSFIVVISFVIFVIAIGWIFYQLGSFGPEGLIFAFLLSLFSSFAGYWWGDKLILSISRAIPANRQEHFNFYTCAENVAAGAQIPTPNLYVIESPALNAFATGRDINHSVVCVTTGLLNRLDRNEIEAVVAHEISHIKNFDTRLMTIVTIFVGMISILANWFLHKSLRGNDDDNDNKIGRIIIIAGFFLIILSPIIAQLIQLAISRRREFSADAGSALITRNPKGLVSALRRISSDEYALDSAQEATENLYIVNPFKGNGKVKWFRGLFNTHPPLEDRITELEKML